MQRALGSPQCCTPPSLKRETTFPGKQQPWVVAKPSHPWAVEKGKRWKSRPSPPPVQLLPGEEAQLGMAKSSLHQLTAVRPLGLQPGLSPSALPPCEDSSPKPPACTAIGSRVARALGAGGH
ncbi:hypothetical protein KIL84_014942 [Mauremys mutica]|uniref:Uncharacterized protein n=1 Tax=Mauremys mutica TaxID=74926 RepID=A0A9D3XRN5_9SAUR|nr:hypothetical protein KIL84_014942 [Mauremys mutica]